MRKRRRSLKCEKVGPVLEEQRHRISRKRVRKLNFHAGKEVTYFTAGEKNTPYRFSTPICYEAILNGQMRKMSDADLFINVTNDAWFGKTAAPHQHAMLAAVQSMEWGRPMIRNAFTGVSFFVEANGNIIEETESFVPEARVATLHLYQTDTIYRMGGWIFPWLWVLGWPVLFVLLRKRTPDLSFYIQER